MDLFESPDYFKLDDLLSEEHKLIRDTTRKWVKKLDEQYDNTHLWLIHEAVRNRDC